MARQDLEGLAQLRGPAKQDLEGLAQLRGPAKPLRSIQQMNLMRSPEFKAFIRQNEHLFWYTPKERIEEISDELLMEQLLNYAELPTIKSYFEIIGTKNAKRIFEELEGRKKQNIYPEIYHLFAEYFKKNA